MGTFSLSFLASLNTLLGGGTVYTGEERGEKRKEKGESVREERGKRREERGEGFFQSEASLVGR